MTVAQDKAMIATLARVRQQVTTAMNPVPPPARNSIIAGATGRQIRK